MSEGQPTFQSRKNVASLRGVEPTAPGLLESFPGVLADASRGREDAVAPDPATRAAVTALDELFVHG